MLSNLVLNANISSSAKQVMASTALEFSDKVIQATDPILVEIFMRVESGQSTYEQEEALLFDKFLKNGTIE
ncbi:MAG: hypothetical protein Q4G13_08025 [Moraxella sp.]|nr:hypothetical protein [Moraxella sp.]